MLMVMMAVVGFIVGFLVGCTGMGGIILIPSLVYLAGLTSHVAMGTTLFTFIFTTTLCSYLYIRLGHVDWKATIPICVGGFLFTYVGADVKAFTAAPYLNLVLALLILLAGALVFRPVKGRRFPFMEEGRRSRFWVLFAVGGGVGFVAGLTGAGGPVAHRHRRGAGLLRPRRAVRHRRQLPAPRHRLSGRLLDDHHADRRHHVRRVHGEQDGHRQAPQAGRVGLSVLRCVHPVQRRPRHRRDVAESAGKGRAGSGTAFFDNRV